MNNKMMSIREIGTRPLGAESIINHASSVNTISVLTNYKWTLHDYIELYQSKYSKGLTSPQLQFTQDSKCKCSFTFTPQGTVMHHYRGASIPAAPYATVELKVHGKFDFHTVYAIASVVDKNMKRLITTTGEFSSDSTALKSFIKMDFTQEIDKTTSPRFLHDGALILYFEVRVIKSISVSPVTTSISNGNSDKPNTENFKTLFDSKKFSDVTFDIEGNLIQAHRCVLAANSPAFEAMFTTDMAEKKDGTVKIDDIDLNTFNIFLKYMYTGKVDMINGPTYRQIITDLIIIADKYQVMDLVNICEAHMLTDLRQDTVTGYLVIAHRLNLTRLEERAIKYIKNHRRLLDQLIEDEILATYPELLSRIC